MNICIDSHQHFWALRRTDYDWLGPELAPLYRDFAPPDLKPLLERYGVQKTVLVQAAPTVDETRYLLSIAEQCEFVAGVVGWVDMDNSQAARTAIAEFTAHAKFVGVRPMIQDIEDPEWITKPWLAPSVEALVEHELCFDALVRPVHLPHLNEFLQRNPDLKAVIDHGGKPDIAAGDWEEWAYNIAALSAETSALCKVSGLINEASANQSWQDLNPYLEHLLACFGPRRLMWGSDWPVLNLAGNYGTWIASSRSFFETLGDSARARIMGGNAAQFYGLEVKDVTAA